MTGDEPPADSNVVAVTGPWTVLSCIAAGCTRCGKAPLDEDTKLTPHFTDTAQAREELTRDWGWICTPRSAWPKDDELLCPPCAAAAIGQPAPPGLMPGEGRGWGTAPWWEDDAPPRDRGASNFRLPPPARRPADGG